MCLPSFDPRFTRRRRRARTRRDRRIGRAQVLALDDLAQSGGPRRHGRYPPRHRGRSAGSRVRGGQRRCHGRPRPTGARVLHLFDSLMRHAAVANDAAAHELTAWKAARARAGRRHHRVPPDQLDRAPHRDRAAARHRPAPLDQGRGRHVCDHDSSRRDSRRARVVLVAHCRDGTRTRRPRRGRPSLARRDDRRVHSRRDRRRRPREADQGSPVRNLAGDRRVDRRRRHRVGHRATVVRTARNTGCRSKRSRYGTR